MEDTDEELKRNFAEKFYNIRARCYVLGKNEEERKALEIEDWFRACDAVESYKRIHCGVEHDGN